MGQKRMWKSAGVLGGPGSLECAEDSQRLAGQYQMHPTQIHQWKRLVPAGARELFRPGWVIGEGGREAIQARLH